MKDTAYLALAVILMLGVHWLPTPRRWRQRASALIDYEMNGEPISARAVYIEVDPTGC